MRFLGSKTKISKQLCEFLNSKRQPDQIYVEPCCGACAITRKMDNPRICADICPYLITFFKQLQDGWIPPEHISEKRYQELKQLYKSGVCNGEIGFAGYFCSFGGKWFGGYARDRQSYRDFSNEAYRDALRLQEQIQGINFQCCTYSDTLGKLPISQFHRCLVYIDPPYEGATGYKNKFNHDEFWEIVKHYSSLHDIYVSSYVARPGFECVWSIERNTELNTKNGKAKRIERVFKYLED